MAQLMLINPRKRRRGASAARMAAIRPKRRRRSVARVSAPRRRRVALSRNPIARRHHRHIRRRIRRNPMSAGRVGIGAQVMNGLVGGVGGLAVDVVQGYLPLPASLMTGYGPYVVKGALALLLGTLGRKVLGNTAAKMGAGAMTIAAYGALKTATAGMLPGTAAVAGMGYMSPTRPLGEYLTGPGSRMGEYLDSNQYANSGGFGNY